MSLINDMLRDLEARRTREQRLPAGLRAGLGNTEARGRGRTLRITLFTASSLLIAAVIWLAWQRYSVPTMAVAPSPVTAVPAAQATLPEPAQTSAPPAVTAAQIPAAAAATASQAETSLQPAPMTAPTAAPVVAPPTRAVVTASEPPTSAVMERTVRAPTPSQQAELEYQRGVAALRGGILTTAETALRTALQHDAAHLPARETLAAMLLGAGRLIEAEEILEQGRRFFARNPTLALLLARLHVEQDRVGVAVTLLEQNLHAASTRADYLAFLAALYQRELRYDDSIESYGRALALQPQQAGWWAGLAISLENAGRRSDAVKAYEQAAAGTLPPQLQEHVHRRLQALQ